MRCLKCLHETQNKVGGEIKVKNIGIIHTNFFLTFQDQMTTLIDI